MTEQYFPWLEACVLIPLLGGLSILRVRDAVVARNWCLVFSAATLAATLGAWVEFYLLEGSPTLNAWPLLSSFVSDELLAIDQLSAPLLPLVGLLYFLGAFSTLRTKLRQFSFGWVLISEAITLATFATLEPWAIIALMVARTVPPYLDIRARHKSGRVYLLHMGAFVGLLVLGWACVQGTGTEQSLWALIPLLLAVLIRTGVAPFHVWVTDLFERSTFGTAVLYVTPMAGAYLTIRLILPIAPDWMLWTLGTLSLVMAVYAAGMSLVQKDVRRFFCFIFLSHSMLVMVGIEMLTPMGLTGALCVWLSIGLAMGGFGLSLRALESRLGRLSLATYQGLYEHMPVLAMCFLLTGLASVGFPGTFGFIGTEILVEGAVEAYPFVGVAMVVAAALNGIAVVQVYFKLFTGKPYLSTVSLVVRKRERFAVLALATLILLGGLFPQPGVRGRHDAATEILSERRELSSSHSLAARRPDAKAQANDASR